MYCGSRVSTAQVAGQPGDEESSWIMKYGRWNTEAEQDKNFITSFGTHNYVTFGALLPS